MFLLECTFLHLIDKKVFEIKNTRHVFSGMEGAKYYQFLHD